MPKRAALPRLERFVCIIDCLLVLIAKRLKKESESKRSVPVAVQQSTVLKQRSGRKRSGRHCQTKSWSCSGSSGSLQAQRAILEDHAWAS